MERKFEWPGLIVETWHDGQEINEFGVPPLFLLLLCALHCGENIITGCHSLPSP